MSYPFRVVKRNKDIELYNPDKIRSVGLAAGMSEENAQKLQEAVTEWATQTGKPLITTIQLRDHVIVEMQKIDHDAVYRFVNYESLRDKTLGGPVE